MSWSNTYSYTLAIAVDMLTASVFWNKTDVCVSSLAGLNLRRRAAGLGTNWFLYHLGLLLNRIQTNHCELSIQGDLARANSTITLLSSAPSSPPSTPDTEAKAPNPAAPPRLPS